MIVATLLVAGVSTMAPIGTYPLPPSVPLWTPKDLPEVEMPMSGLGSCFGFTPPGSTTTVYDAVLLYLKNGGRAVHGAWMYCNQEAIGRAVADSSVPREEVFLMSMLPQWYMGYNETIANFEDSLTQLNTSYVDLYMFHWPGLFPQDLPMLDPPHVEVCGKPVLKMPDCKAGQWGWKRCRLETWRAMSDLQTQGKIKALGVSNFEIAQMQELVDLGTPPAVNQIEYHLGYHDDMLVEYGKNHSIIMQAYSPLGGGHLATSTDEPLKSIAAKHNVSVAQASLKFIEQRGVAAIPKASTAEYQAENLDLAGFTLTETDMVALGSMANPNRRGGADGMGMMCIDTATGKMARCYYLD